MSLPKHHRWPWQRARRPVGRKVRVGPEARELHGRSPIADLHAHQLLHLTYWKNDVGQKQRPPKKWNPFRRCQWDLPRAVAAGVRLQFFTVYVPMRPPRRLDDRAETWRQLEVLDGFLARESSRIALARTTAEARAIVASGRIAAMLAVEGGHSLGGDPGQVAALAARGVRYLTFVHFADNGLAQGVEQRLHRQEPLTAKGREVIKEMERHRMLLDVAHLTRASFDAVAEATSSTLVSTHTGACGLADLERNLTDAQIAEIVRRDGLIGVIPFPPYLKGNLLATLDDLADVYCYLAERAGPRHLAFGSDFDGFIWTPIGLRGVGDLPRLTQVLLERGFSEDEVGGMMGGNAWRLLERMDAGAKAAEATVPERALPAAHASL